MHLIPIPPSFKPLNIKVIQWNILVVGIYLLEYFGSISSRLIMVVQSNIKVWQYHYMEKDPQVWQTFMHHIMMLQQ